MFKFIYANSAIIDEVIYILCGIVCIMTGIRGLKNKKAPIGTFLFWTILGILLEQVSLLSIAMNMAEPS